MESRRWCGLPNRSMSSKCRWQVSSLDQHRAKKAANVLGKAAVWWLYRSHSYGPLISTAVSHSVKRPTVCITLERRNEVFRCFLLSPQSISVGFPMFECGRWFPPAYIAVLSLTTHKGRQTRGPELFRSGIITLTIPQR